MKAIQYLEPGKPAIIETEIPRPGEHEVLVRIEAVTTCPHWDMHIMAGEQMLPGMELRYPYPVGQPGHEAAGIVEEVGSDVKDLTPGMRVAAWRDPGQTRPGSYATFNVFHEDNLLRIPENMDYHKVASLELAMCVQVSFDRLMRDDLVAERNFAVSGLGPAGLVAIQMARAYGAAKVTAIEPAENRRNTAAGMGFENVFAPDDAVLSAMDRGGNDAFDGAIDCTGLKSSIELLMDRTRYGISIFGVLRDRISFEPRHWHRLGLLGYGDHNRNAAERALSLVIAGSLDLEHLISATMPLSAYLEGVRLLQEKKAIKVCFLPWE